ncbi:hypothetical protein V7S43_011189 [Phytophthora oleae]|uniref:RxLR effector protein n=1 Tax=Phytophthora oleae TaxID=2107226 RepID=A0ABD3FE53_9STRA
MKLLKLDDDVENVLKSDNFRTFEKYVTVWNENSSNTRTTVLGTLTAKYGDVAVARALVTAKDARETERTALKLQNEQFDKWLKSEMSVDDVLKLLRLKEDRFEAIGSRKLEILDGYIKMLNREKSGDETLLNALTIGFGTETKLAAILLKAKAHKVYPRMEENATKLQNALFKKWLDEGLDSVDSVLTRKYKIA